MAQFDAGKRVRAVLSIARSSVVQWSQRLRATGSVARGKIGGHVPRKIRGAHGDWLRARIAKAPFTLRRLRVDYHTMWSFAHSDRLSFKKPPSSVNSYLPR